MVVLPPTSSGPPIWPVISASRTSSSARQVEYPLGVFEDQFPGRRQRNLAVAAIEQPGVEVLLQLLDLKGHRGLRHEQHLGRLGERQLLGYGVKHLKSAIGHNGFPLNPFLWPIFNHKLVH